jgi:hypothetical protein
MTVFTPIEDDPDFPMAHAAVLEDGSLLIAPSGSLDTLVASLKTDAPRSPLTELLAAEPAAPVIGVMSGPAIRELAREDPDFAAFAGLKSVVVRFTAGEKVEVAFRCTAEGEGEAQRVVDAIGAEVAREKPELKDRVQVKREGAVVTGTLTLTLEEMIALALGDTEEVEGCGEAEDEAPPPER